MNVTITIETGNDAFVDAAGAEVARILRKLAAQVDDWPGANAFRINLLDINGNTVGACVAED